jgi:hypothetical protein
VARGIGIGALQDSSSRVFAVRLPPSGGGRGGDGCSEIRAGS